jgi:hypothetical protein
MSHYFILVAYVSIPHLAGIYISFISFIADLYQRYIRPLAFVEERESDRQYRPVCQNLA